MKPLLFCLFSLLLCLSAKKKHLVSQDEENTCQSESCLKCPDSPSICTECTPTWVVSDTGDCICPEGTRLVIELGSCWPCGYKCKKCDSEGQCLVCDESTGLVLTEYKICGCPKGSYMSFTDGDITGNSGITCEKCVENCNKCYEADNCFKCQEGFAFDYDIKKCIKEEEN